MKLYPTFSTSDLRTIAAHAWGQPLAASHQASLWRCPSCERKAHSLLVVTADQFRCLGRCGVCGGLPELEALIAASVEELPDDAFEKIGA